MTPIRKLALSLFTVMALVASAAIATNLKPLPNVVASNGTVAPQILSTDPQIAQCTFGSTGVTVTESTLTKFASATEFPCSNLRGAVEVDSTNGLLKIERNGLYRVDFDANCVGVTTETLRVTAQYSVDGGSNYTQITGADAKNQVITNGLTQNLGGSGYVSISQTAANLAADNVVVALFGSSSGAGDMTCDDGGGIRLTRVDQAQPATYP